MQSLFNSKIQRSTLWQLFIAYCCVLFYVVFLTPNRYIGAHYDMKIVPLWYTLKGIHRTPGEHFWAYYTGYCGNIFGNILLFMPFGYLLKQLHPPVPGKQILLYGVLTSMSIELLQYFLQIGVCDVDDLLLNVCGTGMGLVVCKWMGKRVGLVVNTE